MSAPLDGQSVQNLVTIAVILAGAVAVYKVNVKINKSKIPAQTIKNLEESNSSYIELDKARQAKLQELETKLQEALDAHANEKIEWKEAIADLNGQIKVYKELPLRELAAGIKAVQEINNKILQRMEDSATTLSAEKHDGGLLVKTKNGTPLEVKV